MKVELSEQDVQNLIVLIHRAQVAGEEQEVAVMLKMRLRQALQPSEETKKVTAKAGENSKK